MSVTKLDAAPNPGARDESGPDRLLEGGGLRTRIFDFPRNSLGPTSASCSVGGPSQRRILGLLYYSLWRRFSRAACVAEANEATLGCR